jgi:thymidylate kinase
MDNSFPPFLIEFVGVPSSGKSTLSYHVAETLANAEGIPFVSQPTYVVAERLPAFLRPVVKLPFAGYGAVHEKALLEQCISSDHLTFSNLSLLFNWLFVRGVSQWYSAPNRITALDQGFIQALWSLQLSESSDIVSCFRDRLLEVFPRTPSLIVCVEVSIETAKERLANRSANPSRVGVGPDASFTVGEALSAYRYIKNVVRGLVKSRPRAILCVLPNEEEADLTTNVEVVSKKARSMLTN